MRKFNLTTEQEIEIIEKRENGYPIKDLILEYNIKSVKTIYDIIKRNGRDKLVANKKYDVNDNIFEEIDSEEKAYWLGFLYADGYVRMKDGRSGELKLKLKLSDRNHIEKFRLFMESNHLIKDGISKVVVNKIEYTSYFSSLSIYNTKIVKDLIKYGCMNAKTFLIKFPPIKEELIRHFIRGYFDGDGSVSLKKNKKGNIVGVSINFCSGSDLFLKECIDNLVKYANVNKSIVKCYNENNYSNVGWYNLSDFSRIYHFFYKDTTVFLKRKKETFDRVIHIHSNKLNI